MLCGTCAGKKISIHAAREGGDRSQQQDRIALPISIHAAREGGDPCQRIGCRAGVISIHAAREGGDSDSEINYGRLYNFNPRRP